MFGQKKFRFQNFFGSKNIFDPKSLDPKILWAQKIESEKYFESKIFGPPPLPYGIEF